MKVAYGVWTMFCVVTTTNLNHLNAYKNAYYVLISCGV
jgi:hypothetical protein